MQKGILFLTLFISLTFYAQTEPAARQIALGNSAYALADDAFSLFYNPAGFAQIPWIEISAYYSPSPFGLNELSTAYFAVNRNFGFLSAALGASVYGYELYRETTFAFGVSKRFFKKLFVGFSTEYRAVSVKNYGSSSIFEFNLGAVYYLNETLKIGFASKNLLRAYFAEENDAGSEFSLGAAYFPIENASIIFAVTKELGFPLAFKFGTEYGIFKYLDLRIGYETEPKIYTAGVGVKYGLAQIDYAVIVHRALPLTHQASVTVAFENIENRTRKIVDYVFGK